MAADFSGTTVNPAGLRDLMNEANESACVPLAEQIAGRARETAPVLSGAYRDSIHTEVNAGKAADGSDAFTRVVADVRHAVFVEARTGNLARAVP